MCSRPVAYLIHRPPQARMTMGRLRLPGKYATATHQQRQRQGRQVRLEAHLGSRQASRRWSLRAKSCRHQGCRCRPLQPAAAAAGRERGLDSRQLDAAAQALLAFRRISTTVQEVVVGDVARLLQRMCSCKAQTPARCRLGLGSCKQRKMTGAAAAAAATTTTCRNDEKARMCVNVHPCNARNEPMQLVLSDHQSFLPLHHLAT